MNNDQDYITIPESQEQWDMPPESPGYSKLAEFFVLFLWVFLCLEGIFTNYIEEVVVAHSAIWTRVTPYLLYPSELLFYGPVLIISIAIMLFGKRSEYSNSRGSWLLLLFLLLGFFQAIHGKLVGYEGNLWLADLRELTLMAIFVPLFFILSQVIRINKVIERLFWVGALISIYSGISGALVLVGAINRGSLLETFHSGGQVLLMMYILALVRSVLMKKSSKLILAIFAFGILLPLHKPLIGSFVVANLFTGVIFLILGKSHGMFIYLRAVKMFFILGIFLTLLMMWTFTLGQGEAGRWLAMRFLKVGASVNEQDISTGRFDMWLWGIDQWKEHPFFGTGFGARKIIIEESAIGALPLHNLLVEMLMTSGIIGFLLWGTIVFIWTTRIFRFIKFYPEIDRIWGLIGIFIWILTIFFSSCWFGRTMSINNIGFTFWISVGILSWAEAQYYISSQYETELYGGRIYQNYEI
jgi:O-antigen ligase